MLVRKSPMRRFRIQVSGMSYGTLRWTPVRIRAIQGHRNFLVQQGWNGLDDPQDVHMTFDADFDVNKVLTTQLCTQISVRCWKARPCGMTFPGSHLPYVRSSSIPADHQQWIDPRRVPSQDGAGAQLLQQYAALESRDEEAAGNASWEAYRLGF